MPGDYPTRSRATTTSLTTHSSLPHPRPGGQPAAHYLHRRFAAGCVALLDANDLGAQDERLRGGRGLLERGLQEGEHEAGGCSGGTEDNGGLSTVENERLSRGGGMLERRLRVRASNGAFNNAESSGALEAGGVLSWD